MSRERQENLEKYQQEMQEPEISLENAELCSEISKYSAEDNEVVFWKKKELEIREKYYGKDSPELGRYYDELSMECLQCTKYKQSLTVCKKTLKIKESYKFSFQELLKTYAIMMNDYMYLNEYEMGLKLGREILNDDRIKEEVSSVYLNEVIINLAYFCRKSELKEEMKKWIEFGLDLSLESCGRNSELTAQMYVEKADELVTDKDEKKVLFMEALTIFLSQSDINESKIQDTFRRLWWCWREESDKPIDEAMKWLEVNMEKEYYIKIKRWKDRQR
mgnify:CR=1 FL=1